MTILALCVTPVSATEYLPLPPYYNTVPGHPETSTNCPLARNEALYLETLERQGQKAQNVFENFFAPAFTATGVPVARHGEKYTCYIVFSDHTLKCLATSVRSDGTGMDICWAVPGVGQ